MSNQKIYCSCLFCKEVRLARGLQTHLERSHGTDEQKSKYRSGSSGIKCSCLICKKEVSKEHLLHHIKSHLKEKFIFTCLYCNKEHNKNQPFCSSSCAASFHNQERKEQGKTTKGKTKTLICFKCGSEYIGAVNTPIVNATCNECKTIKKCNKIKSNNIKGNIFNPFTKIYYCSVCKRVMNVKNNTMCCSSECKTIRFSVMGKKSAAKRVKRSKDEIKLFELCKEHFNNVEHNIPLVNGWDADIIVNDIKTAILWNGPWHYQDMPGLKHSLKQVQNRDKIKIKELSNAGWNVLIFEDRHHTPQSAFEYIVRVVGYDPTTYLL